MSPDELPFSPAAERNAVPLLEVLSELLPTTADVLEIASGTGQHAAHFASSRPQWRWQPSDVEPESLPYIAARCKPLPNVSPPLALDVLAQPWPLPPHAFDALFSANMLHIAPWATCAALMQAAKRHLRRDGLLVVYGPFIVDGIVTAPSNVAFDESLRARDARWGLRELAEVEREALTAGLQLVRRIEMPSNNQVLVFARNA